VRAVVQRVTSARVRVDDRVVGEIGRGLLVLVGVQKGDTDVDALYVAAKVRDMRVFEAEAPSVKPMDRSVVDTAGSVLVVSQFTLCGDLRKGRRPAFDDAAAPDAAKDLYEAVVRELRAAQVPVATGEFRATMQVELVNDGPVTILLDSRRQF
jgi:D-tyrosyl-tRNA(Tyr) deacylase